MKQHVRGTHRGRLLGLYLVGAAAIAAALLSLSPLSASGARTRAKTSEVLVVGAAQGIPQLNPAVWDFSWEETMLPLLWDGLTKYNPNGSVGPDLATSWTPSNGGRQWTFHLRTGVTFSNGQPFTSADVVNNFNYYLRPNIPYHDKNQIAEIKTVTAPDPNTVVFTLSEPYAILPQAITGVHMIYLPALSTIDKDPIGTGPFIVKSFVVNGDVTLVRNPKYWGKPPSLNEIDIKNMSDPTAAYTALRSGALDVFWSVPYPDVTGIKSNTSLKIVSPQVVSQYIFWEVDVTHPPFNNVKARQALAYSIDRATMARVAYYGQAIVSWANDPIATNNPAYDKHLNPYSFNLAKAKKLFAEAGVKSFTWWGTAGLYPEWSAMGQILQSDLKKIGITVNIKNVDLSTWSTKFYPGGKSFPGLVVPNFTPSPAEPAFLLNMFLGNRCECNWHPAAYLKLYQQAAGTVNASKRQALWDKLQVMVNQQVPVMFPFQADAITAVRSNVDGVWIEGGGQVHLEDATIAS